MTASPPVPHTGSIEIAQPPLRASELTSTIRHAGAGGLNLWQVFVVSTYACGQR
jgi:hypothetical protein